MNDPRAPEQAPMHASNVAVADPYYDPDISPLVVLTNAFRHLWVVILVTVLCSAVAVAAALIMTPIFRVQVVMTPVANENASGGGISNLMGQFGNLASIAGISMSGGDTTNEAIATLESRAFTEAFINDKNLLPVLFDEDWDSASNEWTIDDDDIPTPWDGYELFERKVRQVTKNTQTGIVRLIIEWKDPVAAASWANEMIQRLNSQIRERAIRESEITIELLKEQLANTSVLELRQAIYRLIESQIKTITLARVRDDYSFRIIDPAVAPNDDAHIRPKRAVIAIGGFIFGLFLGIAAANALVVWKSRPQRNLTTH